MSRETKPACPERVSTALGTVTLRCVGSGDREELFRLLSQLTVAPVLSEGHFAQVLSEIDSDPRRLVVVAALERSGERTSGLSGLEDSQPTFELLGTASLILERKFLRNGGVVGHVEDVVVDSRARGFSIGRHLLSYLVSYAQTIGCYKVCLDCSETNAPFYERCGFSRKEVQMVRYFE